MFVSTVTAPASAQSLEELLKQTIEPHDRVAAAQAEVEAQRNKAREALGDWFPTLTPTGTYGWEKQNKPGSTPNTSTGFGEFDLKLSQLLWDFGATNAAVEKARLQLLEAEVKLVQARQDLMLEAATAYVNLLRAHQVLAYAKQSEENIRKQTGLEEARVESGAGLSTDVLQAKTQLAGAEARRIQAAGGLVSAINRFRAVFGRDPGSASGLVPVSITEATLPVDLNSAVAIAQDNNAQLILANLTEAIAREDVNATKSKEFFPKIEGALEQKWKRNVAGTLDNQIETVAKVEVSIPFNLGFTGVNKLRAAQSTLLARTRTVADTRRRVEEQVRNAWDQLRTAKDTATSRRTQASIAEAFLDLARKERQLGQRSLIDVLSGETSLINAQSDAVSAETDVLVAAFGLIKEIGRLGYDSFRPPTGTQKGSSGDDAAAAEPPWPRGDAKAQAEALTRRLSLAGTAYQTLTPMIPRKPAELPPAPKASWTRPPPEASTAPLVPPAPHPAPTKAVTMDDGKPAEAATDLTLPPGGLTAPVEPPPKADKRTEVQPPAAPPAPKVELSSAVPDDAKREPLRSAKVVSLSLDPAPPKPSDGAKTTADRAKAKPPNDEPGFLARLFSGAKKPATPVATAEVVPAPVAAPGRPATTSPAPVEIAAKPPAPTPAEKPASVTETSGGTPSSPSPPDRSAGGFKPLAKDQDFFVWLFSHAQPLEGFTETPPASPPAPAAMRRDEPPPSAEATAKPPAPAPAIGGDKRISDAPAARSGATAAPVADSIPRVPKGDNPVVALVGGFFGAIASLFTGDISKTEAATPRALAEVPAPSKPAPAKIAVTPGSPQPTSAAEPAQRTAPAKDRDFFVWLFSHARMPESDFAAASAPEERAAVPTVTAAKTEATEETPPAEPQPTEPPRIWRAQATAPPVLKKNADTTTVSSGNPVVGLVSGFFGAIASLFTGELPNGQPPAALETSAPPPKKKTPKPETHVAERIADAKPSSAAEPKSRDPLLGGLIDFIANNQVFDPTPGPAKP